MKKTSRGGPLWQGGASRPCALSIVLCTLSYLLIKKNYKVKTKKYNCLVE